MGKLFPVIRGVGIHTGREFELTAMSRLPKSGDKQGAQFFCQNPDMPKNYLEAPAHVSRISGTSRSTALVVRGLAKSKAELKTIEHLMAAYHVAGFPNLNFFVKDVQEQSNTLAEKVFEIPILKGSAQGFESFFEDTALAPVLETFVIRKPFVFEQEGKIVSFEPDTEKTSCSQFRVEVEFSTVFKQSYSWEINWLEPEEAQKKFWSEICKARTFGFSHELDSLRKRGLGLGGTLDNAVLIEGDRVVNPEGFLMENELAAHKLLDALGDFALLGGPILGKVTCKKAGHALHLRALTEAFKADVFEKTQLATKFANIKALSF